MICILKAKSKIDKYVKSCEDAQIKYEIIDIFKPGWIQKIKNSKSKGFLVMPSSGLQEDKSVLDEKLYVIDKILSKRIYPNFESIYIYENKRLMSAWLEANNFPHVRSHIFSRKKDVVDFLKKSKFPLVFKANIESGGRFVKIVKSKFLARFITNRIFGFIHSKFNIGYITWVKTKGIPLPRLGQTQKNYMIIQKYFPIKWEWRIVRIGASYFGHKKLLNGEYASGSKRKGWGPVPLELLHLTKDICEKGDFESMAVDIFETKQGEFLVNELQAFFGQSTENLMIIEGKPGRYIYTNGTFQFEEGYFNQNGSYLLRVNDFVQKINSERNK